jgi:hypothetical protein
MLNAALAIRAQPIEPKRIRVDIDLSQQAGTQRSPLRWVNLTLKNRILNPLAKILASVGHTTQPAAPGKIFSAHIICDKHEHPSFPDERRIAVEITTQMA